MEAQVIYRIEQPKKKMMMPEQILDRLNQAAARKEHEYLRIFNTRTNVDCFTLQKGSRRYLFRDPKYIETLNRQEASDLIGRLNITLRERKFLDFEIIPEEK